MGFPKARECKSNFVVVDQFSKYSMVKRAPNETRQTMAVHGKVWWTCMRCMVVYGGHTPVPNRWEFKFEGRTKFQNQAAFKFEPEFKLGAKF